MIGSYRKGIDEAEFGGVKQTGEGVMVAFLFRV